MGKHDVALVLGVAGVLLGGASFFYAFRGERRVAGHDLVLQEDGERIEQLVEEKTALQTGLQEANKRVSSLKLELEELRTRIAALEAK